ncbi:uncharacterized protein METZ01_LOCUS409419, partial [marine metagenome]
RPADGDYITSVAILTPPVIEDQGLTSTSKPSGKVSDKAKTAAQSKKASKAVKDTEASESAQAQLTMDIEEAAAGAENLGEIDETEGEDTED